MFVKKLNNHPEIPVAERRKSVYKIDKIGISSYYEEQGMVSNGNLYKLNKDGK